MLSNNTKIPRQKRVWWRAVLVAAPLFFVGALGGAYFTHNVETHTNPGMVAMFNQHMISQYSFMQYQEASYPEAKLALERYLKILSSPEQLQSPLFDLRTRRSDSLLTWGRLALLHERNARPDLAETAWGQAERLASESAWRNPSRQRIRSVIERIDGKPSATQNAAKTGA